MLELDWLGHDAGLPSAKNLLEQKIALLLYLPYFDICYGCKVNIGTLKFFINPLNQSLPHADDCFWSCAECYEELLREDNALEKVEKNT